MKTQPKSDLPYLFASGSKSNVKISQIPLVQELEAEWRQNCTTHTSPNKGNSINNDAKEQDTENIRKFVSHIVCNKDDTQGMYKQTPICNGENLANFLLRQSYQAPTKTKHYAVINDDLPHIQQTQLFFTAQAASCPMLIEDQQCSKSLIEALSERCSTERPSAETKSVNFSPVVTNLFLIMNTSLFTTEQVVTMLQCKKRKLHVKTSKFMISPKTNSLLSQIWRNLGIITLQFP
ncbi:uncharacterized protein ACN427_012864 [Glossina fuscipes fuscipes]